MNDKEELFVEWAARFFVAALVLSMVWALTACSYRYIPVEKVRYDSILMHKVEKDSILVRDSVYVREKGDTVCVDKFRYIYKHVLKTDTCFIERRDSVPVPYPVEKRLTRWERIKTQTGGYLYAAVFVYASFRLMRWIVKRTRKRN